MIIEQINKDILVAAKSGDVSRRDILRLLKGTLDQAGTKPTDEDVLATIKKLIKSNKVTIDSMVLTSPKELWTVAWINNCSDLNKENDILSNYLPKEIDEEAVCEMLASLDLKSAKNIGQATGMAMRFFSSKSIAVNPSIVKLVVLKIFNDCR